MCFLRDTRLVWSAILLFAIAFFLAACSGDDAAERMERATAHINASEYRTATIELKNVLRDEAENPRAWFMLGQASLAQGLYADAAHQFRSARQHGAKQQDLDRLLAKSLLGEGKPADALEVLQPEDEGAADARAESYALQGRAHLGLQQEQAAQRAFAAALEVRPDFPPALVGQAQLAQLAGQDGRARQLLQQAIQVDPQYGRAWVVAQQYAFNQKRCDDVIDLFARIEALQKYTVPPAQVFFTRAQAAFCQLRGDQLEQAATNIDMLLEQNAKQPYANYLKGLLAYKNKDYELATTHAQNALARSPDNLSGLILLGMIKTAQGDLKAAQLQFTNAVSQAPDSLRARQLLASIYMQREQPKRAIQVLRGALIRHESDPRVLAQLGAASLSAGQRDEGLAYLQLSSKLAGEDSALQMSLARELAHAGDAGQALALLQRIQLDEDSDEAMALRFALLEIALYMQNEQPREAIATAQALVDENPGKARFVQLLARVYASANQLDEARETLQQALQENPNNIDLQLELGWLALSVEDYATADKHFQAVLETEPESGRALMALADSAARQGQSDAAIGWLEQATEYHPDSLDAGMALARAYLAQNRTADALQTSKRLAEQAPENASAHRLLAIVLQANEQPEAALRSLQEAVSLAPDALNLHFDLVRLLLVQQQLDEAAAELQQIRTQHPQSVRAATLLAQIQLQQGDEQAAMETADSLRDNGGSDLNAYVLRGELLRTQDKYEAAEQAYAKAYAIQPSRGLALRMFEMRRRGQLPHPQQPLQVWLQQQPDDVEVMTTLGDWYQATGMLAAAAEQYQAVLEIAPENPFVRNNLALVYFAQNDERAVQLAQQAHEAQPQNPAIQDTLGWILINSDQLDRGLPLLQQAQQAVPEHPEIRYHLAVGLAQSERTGDRARAQDILTELLAADEDFAGRNQAQSLLQEIRK